MHNTHMLKNVISCKGFVHSWRSLREGGLRGLQRIKGGFGDYREGGGRYGSTYEEGGGLGYRYMGRRKSLTLAGKNNRCFENALWLIGVSKKTRK